jgi:pyruvate formate lyase activating enzyme
MAGHDGGKGKPRLNRRDLLRLAGGGACALSLGRLAGSMDPLAAAATAHAQEARRGFVNPIPASFFSELGGGLIRCDLCPHACRMAPGERGRCQVRENRGGRGYTLAHGNPCVVQLEPVERKPFFHVVPGSRSFSVATAGCNLECGFCEVWDTAQVAPEDVHAYDLPPEAIVEKAGESGARSVAHTFGEPVVFFEYMEAIATLARREGLLSLMHSAGFINPDPLERLCRVMDAANVDLKSFDAGFYRRVCGGELEPVLETLKTLRTAGTHLEVTNILIPTLNDDMEMVRRMCEWIAVELGPETPIHFSRFYPLYKLANLPPTPVSTLNAARAAAMAAGLRYVYVAKVPGHEGENTICPGCQEMVIRRMGFMVEELRLADGRCDRCGEAIPGIWA